MGVGPLTPESAETLAADPAFTSQFVPAVVTTASGDGTTNDLTQLRADLASAAGGRLYLPEGTYRLVSSATENFLSPAAGTTIEGAGAANTVILLEGTTSDYRGGVLIVDDITIRGVTIRRASDFGSVMFPITSGAERFLTEDCVFDGSEDEYTSQYTHGIKYPPSGTVKSVQSVRCDWTAFDYPTLQDNDSTATIETVRYDRCRVLDHAGEALGFNAPVGTNRDIAIKNCHIESAAGHLGISLAHVEGFDISGNWISVGDEGLHIEDYSVDGSVFGNTFYECTTISGDGVIELLDSQRITIAHNAFTNSTAIASSPKAIIDLNGAVSGTTVGGRAKANMTKDLAIVGNMINAGPNLGILGSLAVGVAITGNRLVGGIDIDSSFVETGTNAYSGISLFGGSDCTITGNTVTGFRYGIGNAPAAGSRSFATGTTITGNTVTRCRHGIMGRSVRPCAITGNTVRQCIHPIVVGAHGSGANGAGNDPHTISGNTMYGNQRRASIGGNLVVVAGSTVTVGAGRTLTVDPLLFEIYGTGKVITFSGGGTLTTTAGAIEGATSVTGTVATATIASGEVGIITGMVDGPNAAPWNTVNRAVATNADSVAATYT